MNYSRALHALFRLVALTLLFLLACCSHTYTIVTYNVENLFDDVDDGAEYDRYRSAAGWGTEQFHAKCVTCAEVIKGIGRGGPDVVVLQEVENDHVVEVLCERFLAATGYDQRIVTEVPGSPINAAVISKHPIREVRCHAAADISGGWSSRHILEAALDLDGQELRLLVAHFKSKRGGVAETERSRYREAKMTARLVEARLHACPSADLIVAGDLNESHDESGRTAGRYAAALEARGDCIALAGHDRALFSPWFRWRGEGCVPEGSYVWEGEWLTHDHFLLSPGLLEGTGLRYRTGSFRVHAPRSLLGPDGLPLRRYSDHLPLVVQFEVLGSG